MRYLLSFFALYLATIPVLRAQNPGVNICQASATPAAVRAEGIAELAADIVISCVNATAPGAPVTASSVAMNVFVRLGLDITNNLDFGAGAAITDAVLVVNENNCSSPSAEGGRFNGCGAPNPNVQDPQFGARAAADRLQWLSVRVPVPSGPGPGGPNPTVTTIRLTSIRIRASQLGVPHAAVIPASPVAATVNIAAQGFSLGANGTAPVAYPILGLMTTVPGGVMGEACRAGAVTVPLVVREGLAAALRLGGPPSFFPHQDSTESGYFGAAHPGRLLLRFSNIPAGVRLVLPKLIENGNPAVSGDALRLQWVDGATAAGAGGTVSSQTNNLTFDSPAGGVAFAAYQVTDANASTLEGVPFPVGVSWPAAVAPDAIKVSVYPAPLSAVTASNLAAPEPRFLDAAQPRTLLAIAPCRSLLLFPHVSNSGGETTRLILNNASGNVPGTTSQSGNCALSYRGAGAPADQTTATLASGTQLDLALAASAPGFAGHILATCSFEGALGRAILSRGGGVSYESDAELIAHNAVAGPPQVLPLLFAQVSSQPGFDTRLAIVNPALALPGIPERSGSCRLDYFGLNAPPSQSTSPISPGGGIAFTVSAGAPSFGVSAAPGFSGYVTAICDFNYARGFAAITQYQNPALPAGSSPAIAAYGLTAEPFEVPIVVDAPEDEIIQPDPLNAVLLPYVSARGGHETRVSISNASLDFLGSQPEAGACALQYHGDGSSPAPAPQSFALSAGEQTAFLLSLGDPSRGIAPAPGFRGYLTLACGFPRVRAIAFVFSPSASGAFGSASAHPSETLTLPRNATPAPLLRPYVRNGSGEDRVIVLANTSRDPYGSTPSNGACSMLFRGPGAPGPAGVPLSAGSVRAFLLSRGLPALGVPAAPGFQGFLSTVCDAGLIRALDYRIFPPSGLAPFCQLDSTPGVQPADIVALTGIQGQIVGIGHPGDPDGDGIVTAMDVQYCNSLAGGVQSPPADPAAEPEPAALSAAADLRVAFEASPASARPRHALTLRAIFTNAGPGLAGDVVASIYLPDALLAPSAPSECAREGAAWLCSLGALARGQSLTLQFTGNVSAAANSRLAAFVQVSSPTLDPNPANNVIEYAIPLETQADIAASAYLLPAVPAPGETAVLTVSLTNRGPALAESVHLRAEIVSSLAVLQTPLGCSLTGRELACDIGALFPGRTRAYLVQVRALSAGGAQSGGAKTAIVTGSSSTPEYQPDNNTFAL